MRRLERAVKRAASISMSLALILPAQGCSGAATIARDSENPSNPRPLRFPTPFQIIAHRGASAYAPENTLPAFRAAFALGAYEVELDVQLSSDDVVMIYHDSTLEPKTGEAGTIRDHSAEQLQEMDIGRWFDRTHPEIAEKFAGTRLDTLDQLFETFGSQLYYHIELKSSDPELPRLTIEAIDRANLRARSRITSFQFELLKRSLVLAPDLPHTWLIKRAGALRSGAGAGETALLEIQKPMIDRAAASGFDQVGITVGDLSPEIVRYAATLGISVRAFGIKSDADMMRAIEMGACGMTTNWPDRLIRELVKHMGSGGD